MKSPAVWLSVAVYVLAMILALLSDLAQGLVYIGLSVGIVALVWLVFDITKKTQVEGSQIRRPILELALGCLVYLVFEFTPNPLDFGDKWGLGGILRKGLLLFVLPCVFLMLRKHTLSSMGLSLLNWKQNLKVGGIVLACLAIPGALFVGDTGSVILSGQVNIFQAIPALVIYFIHNVVMSGLPEEFFYRAFLQTRLSQILKSRLAGILVQSLLFGLVHIPNVMRWHNMTPWEAFYSACLLQAVLGILFGVLWDRTHSLIPGVLVHSGSNTLNNLGDAIALVFG